MSNASFETETLLRSTVYRIGTKESHAWIPRDLHEAQMRE